MEDLGGTENELATAAAVNALRDRVDVARSGGTEPQTTLIDPAGRAAILLPAGVRVDLPVPLGDDLVLLQDGGGIVVLIGGMTQDFVLVTPSSSIAVAEIREAATADIALFDPEIDGAQTFDPLSPDSDGNASTSISDAPRLPARTLR